MFGTGREMSLSAFYYFVPPSISDLLGRSRDVDSNNVNEIPLTNSHRIETSLVV